ncbi:sensor histidine kinase [Variovorax terrae]|uniref:ATP-binding protein n=1 Tax=Variovorax terrae TaxID=2923278 RepID=A0A9X2ALM2_9BURK|nr:ATP-binding protein [Variovorax terrae]MCJ0761810.1 ATP-binding protein [Variovorax terrae]
MRFCRVINALIVGPNRGWLLALLCWALLPLAWAGAPAGPDGIATFDLAQLSWSPSATPPEVYEAGTQSLPADWSQRPQFHGHAWYRITFDDPGLSLPAVYLERACTNVEVWINGTLLGSGGRMSEPLTRNCYYPQLFVLPARLLQPTGNRLDIRLAGYAQGEVTARQRQTGLSPVLLGPEEPLRDRYERQYFWNVTVAQIIGAGMVSFGLFMLALSLMRPAERYYRYFGAFQIAWAVIGIRLYLQDSPLPGVWTEILITSLFPPAIYAGVQFLLHYAGQSRRWVTVLLAAQCVVVPACLVLGGPQRVFGVASFWYTVVVAEFIAALACFCWQAWRSMRNELWLIGSAVMLAALLAGAEIAIQNAWVDLPRVHLVHFAMPVIFVAIGARLIQQFAAALGRSERVAQELEQRVAEKSAEIERNYEQLTLLRTAQAAQGERQRIASDLHDDLGAKLLTIAQASESERVAGMARQALDEMRLSVRGLTAAPARAADVLADWRAETVSRLAAAGLAAQWQADEPPPDLVLPARTHVQLTRILREAVSNAIRHSGGGCCRVRIALPPGALRLEVEDDGRGLPPEATASLGHGLPGIERRVRTLEGVHGFSPGASGGTLLRVQVPLGPARTGAARA